MIIKAKLLDELDVQRTYQRFAHQFLEPVDENDSFGIIGMQTRGVFIAKRVQAYIKEFYDVTVDLGVLDITLFRDDYRTRGALPTMQITDIPFEVDGRHIVLVDDVLYTGRTVRSAMEAIMSFGRPASIRFCCMIDRGHRELPIAPDMVGMMVPTHSKEEVRVFVHELDREDAVYLVERDSI